MKIEKKTTSAFQLSTQHGVRTRSQIRASIMWYIFLELFLSVSYYKWQSFTKEWSVLLRYCWKTAYWALINLFYLPLPSVKTILLLQRLHKFLLLNNHSKYSWSFWYCTCIHHSCFYFWSACNLIQERKHTSIKFKSSDTVDSHYVESLWTREISLTQAEINNINTVKPV